MLCSVHFLFFIKKYITLFFTTRFSLFTKKLPFSQSQQPFPKMFLAQSKLAKTVPKKIIHLQSFLIVCLPDVPAAPSYLLSAGFFLLYTEQEQ